MEISVSKLGSGVQVTYGYAEARGHAVQNFPARFKVDPYDNLAVVYDTHEAPSDEELTKRLAYITAPWNEAIDNYGTPRQIQLVVQPWRKGEEGEISV
jgi:hypothetical protein